MIKKIYKNNLKLKPILIPILLLIKDIINLLNKCLNNNKLVINKAHKFSKTLSHLIWNKKVNILYI